MRRPSNAATADAGTPRWLHAAILVVAADGPEGSTRRRVYALVQRHPGLHRHDIARRLEIADGTADHHLHHLVRAGLVTRAAEEGYVRFYVTVKGLEVPEGVVRPEDKRKLGVLRMSRPLETVAHLLMHGPLPMGTLAEMMGLSAGTLTHHVKRLEKVGLVARRVEGRARIVGLVDREDTVRMLLAYEPPDGLVAGFQDLWDEVGF